jgi:hypothetical protein
VTIGWRMQLPGGDPATYRARFALEGQWAFAPKTGLDYGPQNMDRHLSQIFWRPVFGEKAYAQAMKAAKRLGKRGGAAGKEQWIKIASQIRG